MKCKVREQNNEIQLTQDDIALIYSRVTYKPTYETLTNKPFKEFTEETIEVLGGIRTKLQVGDSGEPGTEVEQRRYKFPGQKGQLRASFVIRKSPTDKTYNDSQYEDISLIVGLYGFDKETPFYNKLVNVMTDIQRYKKQTLIYNWQLGSRVMREVFDALPHKEISVADGLVLLDTCFLIHTFEHQKEHHLAELAQRYDVGLTSFNTEEFLYKEHSIDERVREYLRKFLKKYPLTVINVNVHPGNVPSEKAFVNSVDADLLKEIPDASDAVLISVAIKTHSRVLTKDKHHLFTVKLENYIKKYNLEVYKEYHDFLKVDAK